MYIFYWFLKYSNFTTLISACTQASDYSTAINTIWTNKLYYRSKIIECNLVFRLNSLTANKEYGIFDIPSGYQPATEISKIYLTHIGTKVLVTFRTTNVIIIKPFSAISTSIEILYINETWIQE